MPQGLLGDINPGAFILDYGDSPHENIEIRPTLGTINLNTPESVSDVFEEEFADAPVDTVSKGIPVTIDVPFTRLQAWDIKKLFPNRFDIQSKDELILKNCAGYDYFANSRPAVLVPLECNEIDLDRGKWVYFWHVHPVLAWVIGWDRENQKVYQVQFKVYPVQSGTHKGHIFKIGV